jgi:hypothetical protein
MQALLGPKAPWLPVGAGARDSEGEPSEGGFALSVPVTGSVDRLPTDSTAEELDGEAEPLELVDAQAADSKTMAAAMPNRVV